MNSLIKRAAKALSPQKGGTGIGDGDMATTPVTSDGGSLGVVSVQQQHRSTSRESTSLNPHDAANLNTQRFNDVQQDGMHWKRRAEWLQVELDKKKGGKGRNKMGTWTTDPEDESNCEALKLYTKHSIWPNNKFLHFAGTWTQYNENVKICHPFARIVMDQVSVPDTYLGSKGDYYREVALPIVNFKLSNLRGNFATKCQDAFRGEYLLSWWSVLMGISLSLYANNSSSECVGHCWHAAIIARRRPSINSSLLHYQMPG